MGAWVPERLMHVLDDPETSPTVRALLARAERHPPTSETRIRHDGHDAGLPPHVVEAAIAHEERYGGLAYWLGAAPGRRARRRRWGRRRRDHVVEWGLDGVLAASDRTGEWDVATGCDHRWTQPMEWGVKHGQVRFPFHPRWVWRSVDQRLESDALFSWTHDWPEQTLITPHPLELPAGVIAPAVSASGPNHRWWWEESLGVAVVSELTAWWGDHRWATSVRATQGRVLSEVVHEVEASLSTRSD